MVEILKKDRVAKCNVVCAVLMLVLLASQFLPFWQYTAKEEVIDVSIQEYVWMTSEHKGLMNSFEDALGDKPDLNQIILMPIICLVAGVVGVVMCVWKIDSPVVCLASLLSGGFGVWGYLSVPAFTLGAGIVLPSVVSAVLLVLGIVNVVLLSKRNAEL